MQILTEAAKSAAELIGALTVIGGVVFGIFKFVEAQKRQTKRQEAMQDELTVICYGLKACLQGLAEQGCDGPVHDALDKLDKHLNKAAHSQDVA